MKTLRFFGLLAPLFPLASLVTGCGSVADVERREPLALVEGQLTVASLTTPATQALRVAVVWTDGRRYLMADDVPVTPVFPSKFQLGLLDPPPATAMVADEEASGTRIAIGAVVAYEDKNGNGKLDLVDENATSFVDRILGANPDLLLAYAEGAPAGGGAGGPSNGYQLMKVLSCGEQESCFVKFDFLPITTLYEMALKDDPEFSKVMCANGGGGTSSSAGPSDAQARTGPGPNGVWPTGGDPSLTCAADGKSFTYDACTKGEYVGLCSASRECTTSRWTYAEASAPAGWPCP